MVRSCKGGGVRTRRLIALDRSLGMLAGRATAGLALTGAYLVVENIWDEKEQPEMIKQAKALPVIRVGAKLLNQSLPKEFKVLGSKAADNAAAKAGEATDSLGKTILEKLLKPEIEKSKGAQRPGYDNKERGSLKSAIDRLNQKEK